MTIIRQPSLSSIQELYDMQPTEKYDAIVAAINLDMIYHEVMKKSRRGAPEELNYPGDDSLCFYSLCEAYLDHQRFSQTIAKRYRF